MEFGWRCTRLVASSVVFGFLFAAVTVSGQAPPATSEAPQMSELVFKNVALLRGIPVDTFFDAMGMFANAMGNDCTYCHAPTAPLDRAQFATPTARINKAREMIVMVNAINKTYFKGQSRVTCFTCHAGNQSPRSDPNLALQYSTPVEDPNVRDFPTDTTIKPDQVFDRYLQALGGEQRLSTITSLVGSGTYSGFDTAFDAVPVEFFAKAPNQMAVIAQLTRGSSVRAFDGRNGWVSGPDSPVPVMTLTAGNLDRTRLEALASFPTGMRQAFSQWRAGRAVIGDAEVTVLQASEADQPVVNLYFDESGLLVRLVRWTSTPVGFVPTQVEYSDYRDVSGIKIPFLRKVSQTYMQMTIELKELRVNVPIDRARFAKPTPGRTAG